MPVYKLYNLNGATLGHVGSVNITDTDGSNDLKIYWNENDTANRQLALKLEGGNRTLDLYENLTIGNGNNVTITAEDAATSIVLDNANFEVENTNSSQRTVKLAVGTNADATLTIEGTSGVINQDVSSDATVTFAKVKDANNYYHNVKTIKKTIGVPGASGVDHNFVSEANKNEQGIQIGGSAIIPALSRVLDIVLVCTEDFTGAAGDEAGLGCKIGNVSGGTQYAASANVDDVNDLNYIATGSAFAVAPSATASSVYISATPTTNNWSQFTAGKLAVYITFVDNSVF